MTSLARTYSNTVPILLLPPSEGKADAGIVNNWSEDSGRFGELAHARTEVVDALTAAHGGEQRLLGVTGEHLARAQSANTTLRGAPTLPAARRYTGVVWDHLGPGTLSTADLRRIVVVSGLLGLVRGDDPIPDYRLKMSASLAPLGKLSTWWRDELSETLNRYATGRTETRKRIFVDLLPKEHRAAWAPDRRAIGFSIEFVDPTGTPGGHFAKAAKGELARAILTDGVSAVDRWRHNRFELSITPIR